MTKLGIFKVPEDLNADCRMQDEGALIAVEFRVDV